MEVRLCAFSLFIDKSCCYSCTVAVSHWVVLLVSRKKCKNNQTSNLILKCCFWLRASSILYDLPVCKYSVNYVWLVLEFFFFCHKGWHSYFQEQNEYAVNKHFELKEDVSTWVKTESFCKQSQWWGDNCTSRKLLLWIDTLRQTFSSRTFFPSFIQDDFGCTASITSLSPKFPNPLSPSLSLYLSQHTRW